MLSLQDLLNDWESQGSRVQELNKTGSELESLIINITAPQTKTGKGKKRNTDKQNNSPSLHPFKLLIFNVTLFASDLVEIYRL